MRLRVAKKIVRTRRGRFSSVVRAFGVVRARRRRRVPPEGSPTLTFGGVTRPMYHVLSGGRAVPAYDVIDWWLFFETPGARTIGNAYLGRYRVSTVFLGLSGLDDELFETMVFDNRVGLCDDSFDVGSYTTAAEARAGHAAMVAEVVARIESEAQPS